MSTESRFLPNETTATDHIIPDSTHTLPYIYICINPTFGNMQITSFQPVIISKQSDAS